MRAPRGWWRPLLLALGLLLALPALAVADDEPAPAISLLTFGPGALYWERFGHNAILVEDAFGARLYNYGLFDFQQENFFLNFARGRMRYRLGAQSLSGALAFYADEQRWALQQQLDLDAPQRRQLARFLAWNAQPDHAEYRYDYFVANCSTRVRDALDAATGGALRRHAEPLPSGRSFRFEATRLIAPDGALALGMDLGLGPAADTPLNLWQQSFVPMVLADVVRGIHVRHADGSVRPLVQRERRLLDSDRWPEPSRPPQWLLPALGVGVGLAVLLLSLARLRRHRTARIGFAATATLLTSVSALGGLIMLVGWLGTEHWAMAANRNLLLLSPLSLLLLPATLGAARARWRPSLRSGLIAALIAFGACMTPLLLLWPGAQQNLPWIALWLPVHAALAAVLTPPLFGRRERGDECRACSHSRE